MSTELDPLRTFDMDERDWDETKKAVVAEGAQSWHDYAPTLIAAIELGYLDAHLHMLGLYLRERYLHLKDPISQPAPAYAPSLAGLRPTNIPQDWLDKKYNIIGLDGIPPLRKAYNEDERVTGHFKAHGWWFDKKTFIGRHFTSPVPVRGALYRIDSIGTRFINVTVVESPNDPAKLNHTYKFEIDRQRKMFNIPAA